MNSSNGRLPNIRVVEEPLKLVSGAGSGTATYQASLNEIIAQKQLLGMLVSREVRAKYKGSSLGIVWSLVKPVTLLLIYFVAIGQFLGAARSIPDFAIFVFTGLTIWSLYSEIVVSGTHSIINNAGLVKKVYLPREVFPLASVGAALVNFFIQLSVLIIVIVGLWRFPLNANLLYVPLSITLTLVFGTSLGLLFSALNVSLRDIQHLVEVMLLVLFWASPIVYSVGFVHKVVGGTILEQIYLGNPITLAVVGMQKGLWLAGQNDPSQYWPDLLWLRMVIALAFSLVLLFGSHLVFRKLAGNFAQEL